MGAQWVHGVHSDNSVFNFAKKYGLLHENMPRDGLGDMNHESFELEHVYLKGGIGLQLCVNSQLLGTFSKQM